MTKLYTAKMVVDAAENKLSHIGTVLNVNIFTKKVLLIKNNVLWEGQEYAVLKFGSYDSGIDFHTGHYDLSLVEAQKLLGER